MAIKDTMKTMKGHAMTTMRKVDVGAMKTMQTINNKMSKPAKVQNDQTCFSCCSAQNDRYKTLVLIVIIIVSLSSQIFNIATSSIHGNYWRFWTSIQNNIIKVPDGGIKMVQLHALQGAYGAAISPKFRFGATTEAQTEPLAELNFYLFTQLNDETICYKNIKTGVYFIGSPEDYDEKFYKREKIDECLHFERKDSVDKDVPYGWLEKSDLKRKAEPKKRLAFPCHRVSKCSQMTKEMCGYVAGQFKPDVDFCTQLSYPTFFGFFVTHSTVLNKIVRYFTHFAAPSSLIVELILIACLSIPDSDVQSAMRLLECSGFATVIIFGQIIGAASASILYAPSSVSRLYMGFSAISAFTSQIFCFIDIRRRKGACHAFSYGIIYSILSLLGEIMLFCIILHQNIFGMFVARFFGFLMAPVFYRKATPSYAACNAILGWIVFTTVIGTNLAGVRITSHNLDLYHLLKKAIGKSEILNQMNAIAPVTGEMFNLLSSSSVSTERPITDDFLAVVRNFSKIYKPNNPFYTNGGECLLYANNY